MPLTVFPMNGYYVVSDWDGGNLTEYIVHRTGRCSCGGTRKNLCEHIKAASEHVQRGGRTAEIDDEGVRQLPPIPETCPTCNGEIKVFRPYRCKGTFWICPNDASHYWEWRAGDGVRLFLTRAHENKLGAMARNGELSSQWRETDERGVTRVQRAQELPDLERDPVDIRPQP